MTNMTKGNGPKKRDILYRQPLILGSQLGSLQFISVQRLE